MFKGRTKRFLQIISVLLTFAIFAGTFTAAAEAVQNENTNHVWLITDNLTETEYSDNIFNRYEDKNFETNTAEIFTYNESGEVDYTYSLSGSVGDATASLDLNFWHNTNDLGNAPYDSAVAEGSETFLTETDGTNFMNSVYGFGIGWSLDIPQIEYINSTTAYFHNGEGKAYRIGAVAPENEGEETTYKLCGFPYDYTIEKNITFENEEDTEGTLQGFIGTDRYGNKDYFNRDGRFIKSEDKNGNTLKTVTYDANNIISSISGDDYTVNFVREETTDSIKTSVNMVSGDSSKTIGILTVQNSKLSSVLINSEDESSYTTEDGAIATTLSTEGRDTVSFEYEETKLAILGDSESIEVASTISGYKCLLFSNVTVNTIDRIEYSYAATDAEDTASLQLAELYNSTDVAYDYESTEIYNLTNQKDYKLLGVQSSQRNKVISQIERNSTDIVNPGYDPADPNNTEETETNPVSETTTEANITDFSYSNAKVTGCYAYIPTTDDSAITTTDAVVYDYTIDNTIKAETTERVGETIDSMVSVFNTECTKETADAEWVVDEDSLTFQSKVGKNSCGEVVYNYTNEENAVYYKYNSNGSTIIEDIDNGLKYLYTYDQYQELTKTEVDLYTVNYDNSSVESIYVNETPLIAYDYTENNLNSESYANGQSLLYFYDAKGNVTEVYSNAKTDENKLFSYTYSEIVEDSDEESKLLTATDHKNNRKTYYTYTPHGEVDEEGSQNETITSEVYDTSGDIENSLFSYSANPDSTNLSLFGSSYTNTFSEETVYSTVVNEETGESTQEESGKTSTATLGINGISEFSSLNTNDAEGTLTSSAVKNGENTLVNRTFAYDDESRITAETSNGTTLTYTYDDNDNIIAISDGTSAVEYVYDEKNQLIRANDQFNNKTYVYDYDGRGNILSKKEYAYTTEDDLTELTPTKTDSFTYYSNAGINWQDELATFNGSPLTYDEGGNLTSYNGYTYTWANGRQLSEITDGTNTYSYTYNDDGIRTSKTVNGVTTNYITDTGTILAEYTDSYSINYWYDEVDNPIGFVYKDKTAESVQEQVYIYTKNIQGDITGFLDSTGTLVTQYTYDAWGNTTNISGTLSTTVGNLNGLRYRGYYYDNETGHYYLQSRYYCSEFSRFINADNANFIGATASELSINLFAYCENNTVNNHDLSGKSITIIICGVAFSAAEIAVIIGGVTFVICYCCDKKFRKTVDEAVEFVLIESVKSVKRVMELFNVSKAVAKTIIKIAATESVKKNFQLKEKKRTKIPNKLKDGDKIKTPTDYGDEFTYKNGTYTHKKTGWKVKKSKDKHYGEEHWHYSPKNGKTGNYYNVDKTGKIIKQ